MNLGERASHAVKVDEKNSVPTRRALARRRWPVLDSLEPVRSAFVLNASLAHAIQVATGMESPPHSLKVAIIQTIEVVLDRVTDLIEVGHVTSVPPAVSETPDWMLRGPCCE